MAEHCSVNSVQNNELRLGRLPVAAAGELAITR